MGGVRLRRAILYVILTLAPLSRNGVAMVVTRPTKPLRNSPVYISWRLPGRRAVPAGANGRPGAIEALLCAQQAGVSSLVRATGDTKLLRYPLPRSICS